MRRVAAVLLVLGIAAALFAGCSPKKLVQPNVPPDTKLFVQFDDTNSDPHSVYHEVHLYWYGNDPDGYVTAYEYRFVFSNGAADPPWSRTTRTDSLFIVPDTTGLTTTTFQVRAVDNDGVRDATPAVQRFDFTNQAPVVTLLDAPGPNDTTFATQTIAWSGVDPDGDANQLTYRIWLDGNDANAHQITESSFTFPTADFRQGPAGTLRSGPRQAFVQAIDAGGRASATVSCTWYVRSPVPDTLQRARLLLIDNVPEVASGNVGIDNFFNSAVTRANLPPGSWTVQRLATGRPFRSSKDLEQSLDLFDAVVWYRLDFGRYPLADRSDTLIRNHEDGIAAYLNAGGRLYLESPNTIAYPPRPGLFDLVFMQRYMSARALYRNQPPQTADSTVEWGVASQNVDTIGGVPVTNVPVLHSTLFADSVRMTGGTNGQRAFVVNDTNNVVLWARDSTLNPRNPVDMPIAVRAERANGGKAVFNSLTLAAAGGYRIPPPAGVTGTYTTAARLIDKILAYLGATGPTPPTSARWRTPAGARSSVSWRRPAASGSAPARVLPRQRTTAGGALRHGVKSP